MLRYASLFVVVLSTFAFHHTAHANPNIFQAMEAWEKGHFKKAAKFFEPFAKGNPVAAPYIQDLIQRGVFNKKKLPTTISNPPQKFIMKVQTPFRISQGIQFLLNLKKQNKEADISKYAKSSDPDHTYAFQLFRLKTLHSLDKHFRDHTVRQIKDYFCKTLMQNKTNKWQMYRFLLALNTKDLQVNKPTKTKKGKRRGKRKPSNKLLAEAATLTNLLRKHPSPMALYKFANQLNDVHLKIGAAFYGCYEAQEYIFNVTHNYRDPAVPFYWLYYGTQHEDASATLHMNKASCYFLGKGCKRNPAAARQCLFQILESDSDDAKTVLSAANQLLIIAPEEAPRIDARVATLTDEAKEKKDLNRLVHIGSLLISRPKTKSQGEDLLLFAAKGGDPVGLMNYYQHCCLKVDLKKFANLFPLVVKAVNEKADLDPSLKTALHRILLQYVSSTGQSLITPEIKKSLEESACPFHWYMCADIEFERENVSPANRMRAMTLYRKAHEKNLLLATFKLAIMLGDSNILECIEMLEESLPRMKAEDFFFLNVAQGFYAFYKGKYLYQQDPKANRQQAEALWIEALECEQSRPDASFLLGGLYVTEGRHKEAIPLYTAAMTSKSYELYARHNLSASYYCLKLYDNALRLLDTNIAQNYGPSCLTKASILLIMAGELDDLSKSRSYVKEAVRLLKKPQTKEAPAFFSYQVFLYMVGIENKSGQVIFERNQAKVKKLLPQLNTKQQDVLFEILKSVYMDLSDSEINDMLSQDTLEECKVIEETKPNPSITRAERNLKKLEFLLQELEGREVKWSKVRKALGQCAALTSGSITQGEGSRLNLRFNLPSGKTIKTSYHQPHVATVKGGALQQARTLTAQVSEALKNDIQGKGKGEME